MDSKIDLKVGAFSPPEPFECTAETPWRPDLSTPNGVRHANACEVGEQRDGWPGGDLVTLECPNCGHVWEEELPQ